MPPVQNTIPVQPAGNGMPMVQQVQLMPEKKKDISGLVKTIVIIIVSLIAVTFIGLFIWMQYSFAFALRYMARKTRMRTCLYRHLH